VLLPETSVFLYSFGRKAAVMSSQIEGTQSSLSDLMLCEAEGAPTNNQCNYSALRDCTF